MTYTESESEIPFDWNEFLNKETRTVTEWVYASALSKLWTTCACGNQCNVIPRGMGGNPKDSLLSDLGILFCANIGYQEIEYAKDTLAKIEVRSAQLIEALNQ